MIYFLVKFLYFNSFLQLIFLKISEKIMNVWKVRSAIGSESFKFEFKCPFCESKIFEDKEKEKKDE